MKKLLITAALFTAANSFAAADTVYVTGAAGLSKASNFKANNVKHKTKNSFVGDIGAGYNVTDSTRAELVFTRQFDSKAKGSNSEKIGGVKIDHKYKRSVSANAIMARVSQDVYDYGFGKIFLTGGLGIARVQEKLTATSTSPVDTGNWTSQTLKSKNNFAFNIAAGSSFEVQENVMLDVSVSYTDFGKVKSKKVKGSDLFSNNSKSQTIQQMNASYGNDNITLKGKNLRAVSVKAGVRINL